MMSEINALSNVSVNDMNAQRFEKVNQKTPENLEEVKKLSKEFESIFMEIVLKSMRDSVDKSKFIDGGNGEQIFQSMLDTEYAKNLANQNMTGLSTSIEDHLTKLMGDGGKITEVQKAVGRAQYQKIKDTEER
ncbi:MAG: rod-binding protein [Chitinophagaceae bacterium]|nr:rod-binding protein [Oligoflexus sp.]